MLTEDHYFIRRYRARCGCPYGTVSSIVKVQSNFLPTRIILFNNIDFPLPFPFLHALFSSNGVFDRRVSLKPNKATDVMVRRKTIFIMLGLMLVKSGSDIICDT